ncbi:ACT domain-containing protein ACR6-like [Oryza brachyantha]|uniref:ACT domain-containing protein ACR6-like n=1 Tax=Oryza brachyantha TaxID=4533 RepID=UPI001ADBEDAB|nr:ACT domain-containing protein ACR6-like [Oryza brachyantha]
MARCGELVEEEDDDEYAKLVRRMNPPSVVIDNDSCDSATVIRVDRVKKHGILLEAVQVLVDLNLVITKAYISSDGNWFMDVFNVTDQDGNKLQNTEVTDCIKKCLESEDYLVPPASGLDGGAAPSEETTCVELTGTDRPGLLSEVCAVLASLSCNIVNAEVWTHDRRAAAVIQITDEATGLPVRDGRRLSQLQELLGNVMQGDSDGGGDRKGSTAVSLGAAHAERRLHRLMLDDADGDAGGEERSGGVAVKPKAKVVVMDCTERRYTVVILRCRDRPRLLFDTLCALTDLHYVVFHGTVDAEGGSSKEAYQEYYVRHVDGHPVRCDAERLRLVRCLVAAVERRASDGLELEVKTEDRAGLLSEITRVFRENSLSIIRAVITTKDGEADDTFYVSDAYGNPVNGKAMETLGEQLGHAVLRVKSNSRAAIKRAEDGGGGAASIIGNLLKGSFQGFRLIRSYS